MTKKSVLAFLCLAFIFSFTALTVKAQTVNTLEGLNDTAGQVDAFKAQVSSGESFGPTFLAGRLGVIIGILLSFMGVIFLGLIIYAGMMWMTAQGNEQKVTQAKDMIANAIIGLIVVLGAYALTAFIGQRLLQ